MKAVGLDGSGVPLDVEAPAEELKVGAKYAVFSLRESKTGTIWIRAGSAWINRDGSINVYLDVLPLDGKLHIRKADKGAP